jgi:hypothetical protein
MNRSTEGQETAAVVQIANKFEQFLEVYRRPDGSRWSGRDLHDATEGVVTRSYVSNLRKGTIENPGFEKPRAALPLALTSRMLCRFGIEPYY